MISVETSNRLSKLVPMLGSNIDAEALAAVRAIGRVLTAGAADWHDLAEALTQVEDIVIVPPPRPAQRAPEPQPTPWKPPRAPMADEAEYPSLRRTFARTHDAREIRRAIMIMVSAGGMQISQTEVEFLQRVSDECYRKPHIDIGPETKRRLDAIRRRVVKHLAAMSAAAA